MTLLKQGRAVGLGCVLATQNPADVDYKGLTNTGTWFIGRLQAERDKARVIEGLKSAIAAAGREGKRVDYDRIIGQLKPRVFLMHNVHEEEPVIFQTRWVMSYLHGPLTRPQIQALMARRKDQDDIPAEARVQPAVAAPPAPTARRLAPPTGFSPNRQVLDPGIPQLFLPVAADESGVMSQAAQGNVRASQAQLVYEPAILGGATVRFFDRKQGISEQRERLLLAPPPEVLGAVDWNEAQALSIPLSALEQEPARLAPGQGPFFAPVPEAANSASELKNIAQAFADWLYYNSQLTLLAHSELDVVQRPEETERQFKLRLRQAARERRDTEVDRLREKYAAQMERLETKLRKEKREWEQDQADYAARKRESWIATGEMLLTLMRRRRTYRTVSWNASRRRLANRAKMEVEESQQEIEDLEAESTRLRQELEQEIRHITPKWVDILKALTTYPVRPRRADINVRIVGLAWVPSWVIP